jgi:hypothetical protein
MCCGQRVGRSAVITSLIVICALGAAVSAQTPEDIEAELRKASEDTSAVLAVRDGQDACLVFPVSGMAEISSNKVTLKKGTYTLTLSGAETAASSDSVCGDLAGMWKLFPDATQTMDLYDKSGKRVGQTKRAKLKKELTLEVKKILPPSATK